MCLLVRNKNNLLNMGAAVISPLPITGVKMPKGVWNRGRTEEEKERLRKLNKGNFGYKHTEEARRRISENNKGKIPWILGKHVSEETKKKISESQKGENGYWFGKHHSEEHKKKVSESLKGDKCYKWRGGVSLEDEIIRKSTEYKTWRIAVYERDNYTCQKCGSKKSDSFNAHHIKAFKHYPELRFVVSNGLTLCKDCHGFKGFHKKRSIDERKY